MWGRLGIMWGLRVGMRWGLGVAWEWGAGAGMAVPRGWVVVMVGAVAEFGWLGVRMVCAPGLVEFVVLPIGLRTWEDLVGPVGWRFASSCGGWAGSLG